MVRVMPNQVEDLPVTITPNPTETLNVNLVQGVYVRAFLTNPHLGPPILYPCHVLCMTVRTPQQVIPCHLFILVEPSH